MTTQSAASSTQSGPQGQAARREPVDGAPGARGLGWGFVWNTMFVLGALMTLIFGLILSHFLGVWPALAWTVPGLGLMLALIYYAMRHNEGDASVGARFAFLLSVVVAKWMVGAVALWMTGNKAAWVTALVIPVGWSIHIIFSGHRDLRVVLGVLSLCVVPLLGFMLSAAWSEFPTWVALAASVSAIAMVASIATSAWYSNQTFAKLQQANSQAAATKERLEFAIQSAGDGYFEIDLDTMMYTPNPALARGLGFETGPKDMTTLRDRVHPDDQDFAFGTLAAVKEGLASGWKQELRVRVATGGYRWMQLRAQVIEANAAHSRKVIGTVVDLTAWKKIEDDLRAAKEAAEAASRIKSQFLANMSHEIRTPLNGVLGMAQALDADELTPSQKEKVQIIVDSGKSLTALLNDVLDLTKIEAGKLEISAAPGDFLHTIKRTRQLFQAMADDKGIELFVRYDSGFPQRLSYDPVRVRQCVSNLLSNALKFTEKGRVEVAIGAKPAGDGAFLVQVDVIDTGIGMSRETVDKLFAVFTQADGATTRKFGGSGLGLAISRQLARLMGGDLVVESTEGKGSTFRLTFTAQEAMPAWVTAAAPAAQATAGPAKRSLRGARVLLTDDNAINRQVIKLFLAPQGCDIVEATNGKEALDKIAGGDFDVVLLDIHMPVMDGKEAIARLRANPKWAGLPVIALTADAMSGDREKYLALGMTDYVSKPVDQRELVAKMHQVLKLEAPEAAPAAKAAM